MMRPGVVIIWLVTAVVRFSVTPVWAGTPQLTTIRVIGGAGETLTDPVFLTHAPGDFERLFVVEQTGRIKIKDGTGLLGTAFLNVSSLISTGGERGLLGLAFHPNYANNKQFFINYTDTSGRTVVARYTTSVDPNIANTTGETIIRIVQPFDNHNGGWIDFGPDGYLYIGMGDGGDANDPGNRAQDTTSQLLGKMLRIDVDVDHFPADPLKNYGIPPTNPFVGTADDDEIWAFGLRNPWRCSFDRLTGDLYMADVGQGAREEIDFEPAGSAGGLNYGWDCREGTNCITSPSTGCACSDPDLVPPIHEYPHSGFCTSVTGGYVYRGCAMPELQGTYFFADYCLDKIWSFRYDGATLTDFQDRTAELDPPSFSITTPSSFGQDAYGELYILDYDGGEVFKIVPAAGITDCNTNAVEDLCDVAFDFSEDTNANQVPDECENLVPAVSSYAAAAMGLALLVCGSILLRRSANFPV